MAATVTSVSDYQTPRYASVVTGSVTVTTTAGVPDVPCSMVRFIAPSTNAAAVTRAGGSPSNDSVGVGAAIPIAAGTETGWIPCFNVNQYRVVITGTDVCYYEALR